MELAKLSHPLLDNYQQILYLQHREKKHWERRGAGRHCRLDMCWKGGGVRGVEPIRRQQTACSSLRLLFHELNLFFLLLAYAGRKKVLEKSQSMVDRFDSLPPLPPHQPPLNRHHHHHHRISLVESSSGDEAAGYHRFNGSGNDASVNGLGEQPRHGTPSPPPYPSPPDDQPISNLLQVVWWNSSFKLQTIWTFCRWFGELIL